MEPARAAPAPRWTFLAGDPLRGLAALGVLLIHVELAAGARAGRGVHTFAEREVLFGPLAWVVHVASGGLFVFFVLSGYLVGRPFVRAVVLGEPFPPIATYVQNRLLRIVPMFWVTWLLTLAVFGSLGSSLGEIIGVAGFVHIWQEHNTFAGQVGHAWTLDVELLFYLVLPLAARTGLRLIGTAASARTRAGCVVAAALVVAVAAVALRIVTPERPIPPLAPRALAAFAWFAPGVMLAAIEPFVAPWLAARGTTRGLAPCTLVIGLLLLLPMQELGLSTAVSIAVIVPGSLGVVAGPLLHQWATGGCWRWLDNGVTRWLGARSYSIYLLHYGTVQWLLRWLGDSDPVTNFAVLLPLVLLIALPAADLGYRLVERPALRHKRRSITRGGPAPQLPLRS